MKCNNIEDLIKNGVVYRGKDQDYLILWGELWNSRFKIINDWKKEGK